MLEAGKQPNDVADRPTEDGEGVTEKSRPKRDPRAYRQANDRPPNSSAKPAMQQTVPLWLEEQSNTGW